MEKSITDKVQYCISCKNKPCVKGCPLQNDITGFIALCKEKKYKEAYELLTQTTVLSSICGRICPHNKQCQGSCIRGIKSEPVEIGNIEAFIGDMSIKENWKLEIKSTILNDKRVAVVGSGPSGLTCAAFLAMNGCKVTIYEKHDYLGGLLYHGIPEFRLDKDILKKTINKILELGIEVVMSYDLNLCSLEKEYDAIFLGIGANISTRMNIKGEELNGVYGANELLEYKNYPDFNGKKVAVIGGGNVAMDVARTIKKIGAEKVTIIYRRSQEEMPAEIKEIESAQKEKIEFLFKTNILQVIGEEKVEKVECIKTQLVKKEGDTRLSPVNIEGSNYLLDVDYVIMAVGSKTDEYIVKKLNLKTDKYGYIEVDDKNRTSNKKIFAGGDLIGMKSTVAWAAKSGRDAADSIKEFLIGSEK